MVHRLNGPQRRFVAGITIVLIATVTLAGQELSPEQLQEVMTLFPEVSLPLETPLPESTVDLPWEIWSTLDSWDLRYDTDDPNDFVWQRAQGRFDHSDQLTIILLSVRGRFGFGSQEVTRDLAYSIDRTTGQIGGSLEIGGRGRSATIVFHPRLQRDVEGITEERLTGLLSPDGRIVIEQQTRTYHLTAPSSDATNAEVLSERTLSPRAFTISPAGQFQQDFD